MKVSKSPGAGAPEGQNLYFLKFVPGILIQTCCLSTSHILESALTETMSKGWWGGLQFPVTIFHCYTSVPTSKVAGIDDVVSI